VALFAVVVARRRPDGQLSLGARALTSSSRPKRR